MCSYNLLLQHTLPVCTLPTHVCVSLRTHIAVIGNKYRSGDQEVEVAVAQSYAKSRNIPYIETAAHSGEGVDVAFYTLVRLIRRQVSQER